MGSLFQVHFHVAELQALPKDFVSFSVPDVTCAACIGNIRVVRGDINPHISVSGSTVDFHIQCFKFSGKSDSDPELCEVLHNLSENRPSADNEHHLTPKLLFVHTLWLRTMIDDDNTDGYNDRQHLWTAYNSQALY